MSKRSRQQKVQELQDYTHTASCNDCLTSFTWNGKHNPDRLVLCQKCGVPMRVENKRKDE